MKETAGLSTTDNFVGKPWPTGTLTGPSLTRGYTMRPLPAEPGPSNDVGTA